MILSDSLNDYFYQTFDLPNISRPKIIYRLWIIVYRISFDKCIFQNYKNRPSTNRSSKMWVSIKHTYRVQLDFIFKTSSGQFDQFVSTSVGQFSHFSLTNLEITWRFHQ